MLCFHDYSLRASRVLVLARLEAGQRGADAIEVDDLLIALILEDQDQFPKSLSDLSGLSARGGSANWAFPKHQQPVFDPDLANDLLAQVQAMRSRGQAVPKESDLPVSQSAQGVFALATAIRDEFHQRYVEPLHLLLAILAGCGKSLQKD